MKYIQSLILLLIFALSAYGQSATVTLQWDQSPEDPSKIAYRLYWYNVASPNSVNTVDTGSALQATVAVVPGNTYGFYVTAYWTSILLESVPSPILTYVTPVTTVPVAIPPPAPINLNLISLSYSSGNAFSGQIIFDQPASTNVVTYTAYVWTDGWTNTQANLVNRSFTLMRLTNMVPYQVAVAAVPTNGSPGTLSKVYPFSHKVSTNWTGNVRTKVAVVSGPAP